MKITTLIENNPNDSDPYLTAEWGLALHIDFNGHSILFDSGGSDAFVKNAERLAIDLASVDAAVLSHHHFDHGGGLRKFFEINHGANVHLGEIPDGELVVQNLPFGVKHIGLDNNLVADFRNRFVTISQPTEILPGVFIIPGITGPYPLPSGNKRLFLQMDGKRTHDDLSHEIVMVINQENQLIIFTGCSHSGVLNMVDTAARIFNGLPIKAMIGGFHLVNTALFNLGGDRRQDIMDLASRVLAYPIERVYTGHCNSPKAMAALKDVMGERLVKLSTGFILEI